MINGAKDFIMRFIQRHRISAASFVVLIVGLGVLASCNSGLDGSHRITQTMDCGVTLVDLQGTWKVRTANMDFVCPAGTTRHATGAVNSYTGLTVTEIGTQFKISGTGLEASVDTDTCHITYTFIDQDTKAQFECFCTFDPASRTAGSATNEGHCDGVALDADNNGTRETTCAIASPYLGSFIVVEGV